MNGLEISSLNVNPGRFALKDINLNIKKGCVTGLVGKNGAGKTTLIKTITRQQDAASGRILYSQSDILGISQPIRALNACIRAYNLFLQRYSIVSSFCTDKSLYEQINYVMQLS